MPIHLIKLAAGAESVDSLQAWQNHVRQRRRSAGLSPMPTCETRHAPKRREDLLAGGSLYWVVRGIIAVRQRVLSVDSFMGPDGHKQCCLVLDPELVATEPWPRKAFQGWRYLKSEDAPPDAAADGRGDELPDSIRRALMEAYAW